MTSDLGKRRTQFDFLSISGGDIATRHPAPRTPPRGRLLGKRKPSPTREHSPKALGGSRERVSRSQAPDSEAHLNLPLNLKYESPWNTYRKEFSCDLAGEAAVVVHKTQPSKVFLLRSFPEATADKMLQWLTQLKHPNIMSAIECFYIKNSLYALCEDLPLTLEHLVVCGARVTEIQLAIILNQIIDGLSYLIEGGFEHRSIKSSNILMGLDGVVKIGFLEGICGRGHHEDQNETLQALKEITMELMTKNASNYGADEDEQWPLDSDAVRFLSAIASVDSIDKLRKSLIAKGHGSGGELVGLARFALISARTFYSYP